MDEEPATPSNPNSFSTIDSENDGPAGTRISGLAISSVRTATELTGGGACGSGCGCQPDMAASSTSLTVTRAGNSTRKSAIRAAVVGVACVLGCAAGPLIVGAIATFGGSIVGDGRIGIGVAAVIAVALFVAYRRTGRRVC